MKFLYTDGKTGKFSGTTLRTWMLFLITLLFALVLFVYYSLAFLGIVSGSESWATQLNDLFGTMSLAAFGGGGLYLGKRAVERFNEPSTYQNNISGNKRITIKRKTGGNSGL